MWVSEDGSCAAELFKTAEEITVFGSSMYALLEEEQGFSVGVGRKEKLRISASPKGAISHELAIEMIILILAQRSPEKDHFPYVRNLNGLCPDDLLHKFSHALGV